jgi:hypothetical protein
MQDRSLTMRKLPKETHMATKLDNLLPTAGDYMKKLALAEAEEASKEAAKLAAAEAEKQALLDQFKKPSGLSDEEAIQPRGEQRQDRGPGPSLPEPAVH